MDPQDLINALSEQRNSAMNSAASLAAQNMSLNRRILGLEEALAEASKPDPKGRKR
jgi:hypothetical protein